MTHSPPDDLERRQATTTFDRNVVVTAGAGTGKTTLLVERCVNLLMRSRRPVKVTDLVALTFTNKAANEMKARLREELEVLAGPRAGRPAPAGVAARVDALRERYRLTADEIHGRAREALQDLERAQIGTIHSFAALLLRLYPLEAGIDPGFQEDDGTLRKRRFDTLWGLWLSEELSDTGPRKTQWKHALDRFPLDVLRELALALCAEHVDLDELRLTGAPDGAVVEWLRGLDETATDLIERYPGNRRIEQALAAARKAIRSVLAGGPPVNAGESGLLKTPSRVSGWTEHDFNMARNLIADAAGLAQVDAGEVVRLCALLAPFVRQCRREFTRNGLVTFDGLLVRTRDLLHEHPRIREELKARFKAILVDEFQDTDPLQYEILLWLCEEPSQGARNWREIRLVPGKLFVVGDPKQSIYGFRGADMEAYLNVVEEVIEAQDGVQYRLTANFRSDPRILDVVNGVCERLIQERPGLQPEYIALEPGLAGNGREPVSDEPGGAPAEQERKPVTVRRVTPRGATLKAEGARRLEAESLARWLKEEVLGRTFFHDREGRRVAVEPGHVAFLMRALTNVQVYLEALRRHGIRYVVEGERDFYAAQEVIDAVNLLRAIDNPHDRLALVGVLRSPVGGHDDAAIFDLHRQGLLDYRSVADSRWVDLPGNVVDLYQRLHRLHREARFLEAGKAVEQVFKELPLSVLAAGGRSGQQAVANLEKVRLLAREAGAGGSGTLKDVVAELERRVRDREDESENALEEETLDAVRIMSIHRAKGLEFPVVVLVDTLGGVRGGSSSLVEVQRDWASGLTGIHVDEVWNLPGVFLRAKRREREAYEQRRLLYVAMTRPRQRLVVSFADRQGKDGDSLAGLIGEAAGGSLRGADGPAVACGAGEMAVEAVAETPGADEQGNPRPAPPPDATDWSLYEEEWHRRREEYDTRRQTPLFLTPTRLKAAGEATETPVRATGFERDTALELGRLAHKVLEFWDFETLRIEEDLDEAVARHIPELPPAQREAVLRELKAMWAALARSPVYEELKDARILGREIPFVLPWDDGAIMEGVIDVVYERDGQLYVADYKTDQVADDDIDRIKHDYRHQARIYTEAVRRTLGRDVAGFKLLLLRLGRGVEVPPEIAGTEP